ncbi:MAG: flagellar basal body-associated FliL family protein [Notoacmeibacter sp.]
MASKTSEAPKGGMAASIGVILVLAGLAAGGGYFLVNHAMSVAVENSKQDNEAAKQVISEAYSGTKHTLPLLPVITNMATQNSWVRMEAALVYDEAEGKLPQTLPAEITEDILALMRTLTIAHVSGPSGFMHLKEDIVERAFQRSEGRVSDVLILTLVFE